METIAQEAKRLLAPIPEENFIVGNFTNKVDKCCVIGHYQRLKSKCPTDYSVDNCSDVDISGGYAGFYNSGLRLKCMAFGSNIAIVNNHPFEKYHESTSKARVMHLLDDMIAAGY